MFLVDTSVWVDYLRGTSTQSVEKLQGILDETRPFGIDLLLLHSDRDFDDIASVVPELQIF